MRRYNIVPLILLILSIVNFALAAPVLIPEGEKVYVDVGNVPKDLIVVLGKRGDPDELGQLTKLFDKFDRWWGYPPEDTGTSSAIHPSSSSAPLESGQVSTQVHVPTANPASSTEFDRGPESSVSHPSTSSTASSSESDSESGSETDSEYDSELNWMPIELDADPDREAMGVHDDAPPPDSEELIESGHRDAPPSSPGSDPDSALTIGNLGESSNAPSTSATGSILRRGASMSLPGLSDSPKSRKKLAPRGSANPMDEIFRLLREKH